MSMFQPLGKVEKALPIILILNIIPFLFGWFGIGMSLEYGNWSATSWFAVFCFVYLPVALIGFVLYLLIRGHEKAWNVVLHILAYWGILTAGSLFIAWVLMVILV